MTAYGMSNGGDAKLASVHPMGQFFFFFKGPLIRTA